MEDRRFPLLFRSIILGVSLPMAAGQAHPKGPEKRSFIERTIKVQGETRTCILTLAYPKPDDVVDWTKGGSFDAADPFPFPLTLRFDYDGHFWQGVFGSVGLDVSINKNKNGSPAWKDIPSLLEGIRLEQVALNKIDENDKPNRRQAWQEWMDPIASQLNGTPCVQQSVRVSNDSKGETIYYFPLEDNYAIEIEIIMVDNTDRPGLTQSDWRPRAEAFATSLLSTVRVHVDQ